MFVASANNAMFMKVTLVEIKKVSDPVNTQKMKYRGCIYCLEIRTKWVFIVIYWLNFLL